MFVRLTGWMVLLAATSASNDAELLALRREGAMLRVHAVNLARLRSARHCRG